MGEHALSKHYQQTVLVIIIAAAVTSALWFYFYNQKHQLHTTTAQLNRNQLDTLAEQLDKQSKLNQELVANLASAQDARIKAETELAQTGAELSQTQEQIAMLNEQDWEHKYQNTKIDNEIMVTKIAELEFNHEEEIARLQDQFSELQSIKNYIAEDFIKLEFEHDDLIAEKIKADEQQTADLLGLRTEIQDLKDDLAEKQNQLTKQKQIVATLQKENIKTKESLAQKQTTPEVKSITLSKTDPKESGNFRDARLQSLRSAMINRKSTDRKNILVSVIPSIPNGISGMEFSNLVQGMESGDILSVIKSSAAHINRPLPEEVFKTIMNNMNEQDAILASNLLSQE